MIGALGFPGYFLTVWDIVQFCKRRDIFCQGRGSAATSAVCYALGITNVDAVSLGLLFERFLSPARDGPPDIDVDIESGRREEVIQYVYERYGRLHAAQVANVITYRSRSALRDVGKALGHTTEEADAWSGSTERGQPLAERDDLPPLVRQLSSELLGFPRHLGIHSGGMVICDRPVVEVCPVEWGRMPGRSVLQWDKDDCAAAGLVKFDLLGLGMLTALHHMVDLVADFHGDTIDLRPPGAGGRRLRPAVPGRHGGRLPGGVAGPDEHVAAGQAPLFLRPGHRGRPHPARAHPGQRRPPLHPAPQRDRARHLPPPADAAGPGAHPRGAALPGAADADRHRRGRVLPDRGRRAASGHERQAVGRADGRPARPPVRRDGRPGGVRGGVRAGVHGPRRLRQLRVPREPLGGLRPPRLRRRPGASCTTRPPSPPDCSTPSPWASGPPRAWWPTPSATGSSSGVPTSTSGGPTPPSNRRTAPPPPHRRRRPCASACPRSAASARTPPTGSRRGRRGRAWRTWCAGPGCPAPSSRPWPPPVPSTA